MAANLTEGQVIYYNGKIANTVYCDSNGGRSISSEEKWGGVRPYLIAQDDPWTLASGKKKNGHGVGLSQQGAIYAAKNGVSFEDIISFYYPGTKIISTYEKDEDEYARKVL